MSTARTLALLLMLATKPRKHPPPSGAMKQMLKMTILVFKLHNGVIMWLPVGARLFFAYCLALLAGSPVIGSPLAKNYNQLKALLSVCPNLPKRWSTLSEGLRPLFRVPNLRKSLSKLRFLDLRWLIAPFLLTLASCSVFKPKLPTPTPEPQTATFQCVDTALRLCPGIVPIDVTNCADTVKIASAALTALEQCQTFHSELITCVLEHLQQGSKQKK